MSSTNESNEVVGSQPNFSFAFVASPNSDGTSEGRKYLSLTFMIVLLVLISKPNSSKPSPLHSILKPKNGAAASTNSRTDLCSPVAIT